MQTITNTDRARMIAHEIGKHEAALAANRKILAGTRSGNETLRATGEIARLAAELDVLRGALDDTQTDA